MITRKKRILIVTIISLIILLSIIGAIVVVYLNTDLFKSDKQLFFKYFSQNEKIFNIIDKEYIEEYTNKMNTVPYKNSGNVSVAVQGAEENINSLNNFKIEFDGVSDKLNSKDSQNIKLKYDENELFELNYIRSNEKYGLKSDEVVSKYIVVENNNLKELSKKLGQDSNAISVDKIEKIDINRFLNLIEQNKDSISKEYMEIISKQLSDKNFSKQKDINVTIDNNQISANSYSVVLTKTELNTLTVKLLEKMQNDEALIDILLYVANTYSTKIDDIYIKEQLQDIINKVKREEVTEDEALRITVYETEGNLLTTDINYKENNRNTGINVDKLVNLEVHENSEIKDFKILVKIMDNINQENTNIDITKTKSDSEFKIVSNIVNLKDNKENSKIAIQYINEGTMISNNMKTSFAIGININNNIGTFKFSNDKEFIDNVKIDELNDENSFVFNNNTKEENQGIINALYKRILQIYDEKLNNNEISISKIMLNTLIDFNVDYVKELDKSNITKILDETIKELKTDVVTDLELISQLEEAGADDKKILTVKANKLVDKLKEKEIKAEIDINNGKILINDRYTYNIDFTKYMLEVESEKLF